MVDLSQTVDRTDGDEYAVKEKERACAEEQSGTVRAENREQEQEEQAQNSPFTPMHETDVVPTNSPFFSLHDSHPPSSDAVSKVSAHSRTRPNTQPIRNVLTNEPTKQQPMNSEQASQDTAEITQHTQVPALLPQQLTNTVASEDHRTQKRNLSASPLAHGEPGHPLDVSRPIEQHGVNCVTSNSVQIIVCPSRQRTSDKSTVDNTICITNTYTTKTKPGFVSKAKGKGKQTEEYRLRNALQTRRARSYMQELIEELSDMSGVQKNATKVSRFSIV